MFRLDLRPKGSDESFTTQIGKLLQSNQRVTKYINAFSRGAIKVSANFCRINLLEGRKLYTDHTSKKYIISKSCSKRGTIQRNSAKHHRYFAQLNWTNLLTILFLYCLAKLCLNVFYQYAYDRGVLILRALNLTTNLNEINSTKIQIWTNKTRLIRTQLKSIGAPHLNASIAIECVYLTILLLCFNTYFVGLIYFKLIGEFDFQCIRWLIDEPNERVACLSSIKREIQRINDSSQVFTQISIEKCTAYMNNSMAAISRQSVNPSMNNRVVLNQNIELAKISQSLYLEHQQQMKQLNYLLNSGHLWPLNRTREWTQTISLLVGVFYLGCISWSVFFDVCLYVLLPKLANFNIESDWPMDYLFNLELVYACAICVLSLIFYMCIVLVCCLDQVMLIQQINKLISDCIRSNSSKFYSFVASELSKFVSTTHTVDSISSEDEVLSLASDKLLEMNECCKYSANKKLGNILKCNWEVEIANYNANLLHTFVHYKIFISQLRPLLKPIGVLAFVAISLVILHPLLIRFHTPYVASVELKSRYYIIALITAIFVNTLIFPVCYINSRCVDLYKAMSSLLSHTMEVQLHLSDLINRFPSVKQLITSKSTNVYSKHTLWLIRKELQNPDLFLNRFDTRILGLSFTYNNLVRVYFYVGIISISIFSDSNTASIATWIIEPERFNNDSSGFIQLVAKLLRDPFGFHKGLDEIRNS